MWKHLCLILLVFECRATEKFDRKVSFCNQQQRYAVIDRCYRNFNLNFTLFGAATSIPNTITIHNYDYFQYELFSTFISLNKNLRIRNKNQEQLRQNTNATIFIPGKHKLLSITLIAILNMLFFTRFSESQIWVKFWRHFCSFILYVQFLCIVT